ncbi:methionyl-tRNA formyltransferase [Cupriavidus sp. USMAA2-4]|uniref:methionyl-tRNA formyltransferase n=1 Tax=unclassified Cupriavidus TaxID=2640874 RepID=UPI0008A67FD6|nr:MULTISPECIES: methionyl-tRNA formyltransferase [unclassified Cupriavidus]AOY92286.1 methionyl-tRNA formyltransferase [Cupriavidus sp. USMAA2-4]AOY98132.1 methionyl-tRNA formyltransferase [Cupriavidus sp. USMAHM13]
MPPVQPLRVAFAGTPEFARAALEAIHAAGFPVVAVLSQPDRPAGRGMQLQASPVKQYALAQGLGPVLQPRSLRRQGKYPEEAGAAVDALAGIAPDVMVVAAYGLILPAEVLALPRHGCINIHGSLLPRWRGAAPIHRAIEAGDAETGITLMQMDEGLDTGAMLACEATPIAADDSTGSLHDKLAAQGARMVVQALERLARGETLGATPQPADGVTYAEKIGKEEARLDLRRPAAVLARQVRAFNPFPGATVQIGDTVIKCWQARAEPAPAAPAAPAGTVLAADADGVLIACGEGALRVTELQRPGGRRQAAQSFLQGMPLAAGSRCALPDGQV